MRACHGACGCTATREVVPAENSGNLVAMIASFHRPRYDVVPIGAVMGEK
jgi:hypothetical protein